MKNIFLTMFVSGTLMLFSQTGCGQTREPKSITDTIDRNKDQTVTGNFSRQSAQVFDSLEITKFFDEFPNLNSHEKEVRSFYRERNYAYAWFEKGLLIEPAGNLANRILNIESEGVFKKLFYKNALDSLIHSASGSAQPAKPDITLEILLTTEYFVYSKLAWDGMSKVVSKSSKWYLPRKAINYKTYLDSLLLLPAKNGTLREPVFRQYELLRTTLRKYRELESRGKWDTLVSPKHIKPGDTSVFITKIKSRLFLLGDFEGDTSERVYNSSLSNSLIKFQERHGLKANGKIDAETMEALNIPLKNRILQIIVNMERSRWLPVQVTGDYLAVNIPEFKLHVFHDGDLLWSCNAVVGKTVHPTSIFYGEIKYVVFRPYWNIPPGILRNEILPAMRKSSSYLARHQMEITGYRNGLPVIRQKPGPSNALGLVKFLLPNSYNIYLHDTPSKSLFEESTRAFSHGCIRIAEPAKLAEFLLKDMEGWDSKAISKAMHTGNERFVALHTMVPVFISYFTAFVDHSNRINFRKDIYGLDGRLAAMIISGEGEY